LFLVENLFLLLPQPASFVVVVSLVEVVLAELPRKERVVGANPKQQQRVSREYLGAQLNYTK
jgi:hypothetical protein